MYRALFPPERLGRTTGRNTLRRYARKDVRYCEVHALNENALEAHDVVDHEDRSANLDFEVFRHIEQAWFESRGIGDGHLLSATAGAAYDGGDLGNLMIFNADHEAAVAHPQERPGAADAGCAESLGNQCIGQILDIFILNDRKNELHAANPRLGTAVPHLNPFYTS
jgi:hypothetical protein